VNIQRFRNALHTPMGLVAPLNGFDFELGGVLPGFLASFDSRHRLSPSSELSMRVY
jgi:hypothetical protein